MSSVSKGSLVVIFGTSFLTTYLILCYLYVESFCTLHLAAIVVVSYTINHFTFSTAYCGDCCSLTYTRRSGFSRHLCRFWKIWVHTRLHTTNFLPRHVETWHKLSWSAFLKWHWSTCCALLQNRVVIQAVYHNTVRHQSMVLSSDIKQKVRYPEIQSSHLRVNGRASSPCNSGTSTLYVSLKKQPKSVSDTGNPYHVACLIEV